MGKLGDGDGIQESNNQGRFVNFDVWDTSTT